MRTECSDSDARIEELRALNLRKGRPETPKAGAVALFVIVLRRSRRKRRVASARS